MRWSGHELLKAMALKSAGARTPARTSMAHRPGRILPASPCPDIPERMEEIFTDKGRLTHPGRAVQAAVEMYTGSQRSARRSA